MSHDSSYEFTTNQEAKTFVAQHTDRRVPETECLLASGIELHAQSHTLSEESFTNSYDISYPEGSLAASVVLFQQPQSIIDTVSPEDAAIVSGGFFLLSDDDVPVRQPSLNLAIAENRIHSMPVCDREAVVVQSGRIRPRYLKAMGIVSINGRPYRWAGSHTNHIADATVFSNGSLIVDHVSDEKTGARRVVRQSSMTTEASDIDYTDVGLIANENGEFYVGGAARGGGIDLTRYDFVLRMPHTQARKADTLRIDTIDDLSISEVEGAFSAGPLLTHKGEFAAHPINKDKSLGSYPPFMDRRMARLVLYLTSDGTTHFRLFDGRPGSSTFEGVTPQEALDILKQEVDIESGVFLDPGQTAKMYASQAGAGTTYGNRHYLRWPRLSNEKFVWNPDKGRAITSMIRIQ